MTETFAYIAGRAATHRTIIRRNQFSKKIVIPESCRKSERKAEDYSGIIICI